MIFANILNDITINYSKPKEMLYTLLHTIKIAEKLDAFCVYINNFLCGKVLL